MHQTKMNACSIEASVPCNVEVKTFKEMVPSQKHPFFELVFVAGGSGKALVSSQECMLKKGDVFFLKPNLSHTFINAKNLQLVTLSIQESFLEKKDFITIKSKGFDYLFKSEDRANLKKMCLSLNDRQITEVRTIVRAIKKETEDKRLYYKTQVEGLLRELIVHLMRIYDETEKKCRVSNDNSDEIVEFIEKNFTLDMTIPEIARIYGMSESKANRVFKKRTGYSPLMYQNRLRINAAMDELANSDKTITEIALGSGFNDSNYFSRQFKKIVGSTPCEYRRQKKRDDNIPCE